MNGFASAQPWLVCALLLGACSGVPNSGTSQPLDHASHLPQLDTELLIPQLTHCDNHDDDVVRLNSAHAVNVIVHGCFSSAGRFRALSDVFAFHGQQSVCFAYDDRDSLETSSAQLIQAVNTVTQVMPDVAVHLVGHSQGGLIARRATIGEREDGETIDAHHVQLTTISAPFAGIAASAHCASTTFTILSLGLVKPICHLITGAKYREIPASSRFMTQPGTLAPNVSRHLRIATDEQDACRRYGTDGGCVEDDYVFSVAEQLQPQVDRHRQVDAVLVEAGHVEIVGDETQVPLKLIDILQRYQILRQTPAERQRDFAALLEWLYKKKGVRSIIN